ncbi:MAG: hypothetical protein WCZ90_12790 [Melioribacteraceae bacterium]
MATKKKLDLQPNEPQSLTIISDPLVGKNDYGPYYLFMVNNGTEDLSFFAPNEQIYEQLKAIGKGKKFEIIKTARKNGKSIQVEYLISGQPEQPKQPEQKDNYFHLMLQSYEDALKIQEKLNGMCDVNRISITLFIARSKLNGSGLGGFTNV